MQNRTELLNHLIKERGFSSYLEIGTQHRKNFDAIVCEEKVGVDPEFPGAAIFNVCSDDFFAQNNAVRFDCIFVDGLHHASQVERDIVNAMNALNEDGCILIHDCTPETIEQACEPRGNQKIWYGSVWRAAYGFMQKYKGWTLHRFDCGILQIEKQEIEPGFTDYETPFEVYRATYENI